MSPTSPFFNKFDYTNEQLLLDSLVRESIQIYGQDMLYIPIRRGSFDGLYYEDDTSFYDRYYTIETYVKSYDGFAGQQSFMSTIGLEIRDQIVLSISRSRFEEEVTTQEGNTHVRPYEGDILYFPLNNKLFKVLFVDDKPFFYQHGTLQMFDLTCELFEYSNEILNTGIEEVDRLQKIFSTNVFDYTILLNDGDYLVTEDKNSVITQEEYNYYGDDDPLRDNIRIRNEEEANTIFDWNENNPFSQGSEPDGETW